MTTTSLTTKSKITSHGQKNLDKMSNFENVSTILDGKYEIEREIARSGMRIVYEAYHKYTHKQVAIKVILANKVDPIQLKRFQKELEAYSLLSHPNVITIYDAGVYNNYPYIVMEYVEGVDICTYVKQHEEQNTPEDSKNESGEEKERDWNLCARLVYETALGLEYIHSQKMIHRDIKPANIIVRPNGSPVIIDLGLVKFNRGQSYNLTRSREIIGTIEYMPIEQAQGKIGQTDVRTDVYSLGLVLYELLTGQRAYYGKNIMESLYKIMSYYPPLPREINPKIPKVLEKITIRATEKEKEKRYASMKEFSNALKEYLSDITIKPTLPYAPMKQKLSTEQNTNKVNTSNMAVLLENNNTVQESKNSPILSDEKKNQPQCYDSEAQFQLGVMYYKQRDYAKAIYWFEKSANQENAEAQFNLGVMYKNGKGVTQNFEKAVYWFEKSANQGFAKAQFNLGVMYKNGKGVTQNFEKAIWWYEKSANQGHAKAQFNLGLMYKNGQGVQQNYAKAVYWFELSANQGHAEAQYNLGLIYADGKGVQQNYAKAVYWYEKSANQGLAEAQLNLGLIYTDGKGVQQNYAKAVYWFEKSASQGLAQAQNNLGNMYKNKQGVQQDFAKAIYWFEKSASQGYAQAQFNLGSMYKNGQGVQRDYAQAVYWFEKSANQGYAQAQFNLGSMYKNGQGVQQNYAQAVYWFGKSASQGYAQAQFNLGSMYKNGQGVQQDFAKAVYWFGKSASQGYAQAQCNLGLMYENGQGVEKDLQKAVYWYKQSANQGHDNSKN